MKCLLQQTQCRALLRSVCGISGMSILSSSPVLSPEREGREIKKPIYTGLGCQGAHLIAEYLRLLVFQGQPVNCLAPLQGSGCEAGTTLHLTLAGRCLPTTGACSCPVPGTSPHQSRRAPCFFSLALRATRSSQSGFGDSARLVMATSRMRMVTSHQTAP